jgi:uncharacterized protein YgiM (DUF1202 family)
MSRHNYSQYSKNNNEDTTVSVNELTPLAEEKTVVPAAEDPTEIKMVVETVETVTLPKIVTGVVANCQKLNIRMEPNTDAEIVTVLNAGTEIEINVDESNDKWFSICTVSGVKGYCMRKFVNAHL